jgi:hypothetical protein
LCGIVAFAIPKSLGSSEMSKDNWRQIIGRQKTELYFFLSLRYWNFKRINVAENSFAFFMAI